MTDLQIGHQDSRTRPPVWHALLVSLFVYMTRWSSSTTSPPGWLSILTRYVLGCMTGRSRVRRFQRNHQKPVSIEFGTKLQVMKQCGHNWHLSTYTNAIWKGNVLLTKITPVAESCFNDNFIQWEKIVNWLHFSCLYCILSSDSIT